MFNKLTAFCSAHNLLSKGDSVTCAVSGGADSMALLWAMYLLKDSYDLKLSAVHFNHGLRGEESDADAAFVEAFCKRYEIPLYMGKEIVAPGKKGLEAAARDARYAFFESIPGKIATAHTANDNAETVLMHIVRGTGLKGLGGITPCRGKYIRPMLSITREEVIAFLDEYHINFVTDSSNEQDTFLRNRLRHQVMPVLLQENPRLVENMSAMALRLRDDESFLAQSARNTDSVEALRNMQPALRYRSLASFLEQNGVADVNAEHISLMESIVFSNNPSASVNFAGGVVVERCYDKIQRRQTRIPLEEILLSCPGDVQVDNLCISCKSAEEKILKTDRFTVCPNGAVVVRHRKPGDTIRLHGGTKKLKELFIDLKIPAGDRDRIPVIADDLGVLGVYGIGANLDRVSETGIEICFEQIEKRG